MIKEEQTGQLTLVLGGVGVHEARVLESEELVRAVEEKPQSQIMQEPIHPMVKKIQEIQSKPAIQNIESGYDASQPIVDPKNLAVEVPVVAGGGSYLSPGSVGASGTSGYNSQQSTVTSDIGVSAEPVITMASQERDKSVENSVPATGHQGDLVVKEAAKEGPEGAGLPTDSDTGTLDGEGKTVRKKTKKERKRTHLGPRIKVLRIVTGEEALEPGQVESTDPDEKTGVKVECQMETSKQKTVTFEFSTTENTEEMANTFIREDLLAEQHRKILVEQLVDIVSQLTENPEKLPSVTFPPEECLSPTREKRERSSDSARPVEELPVTAAVESKDKDESPQSTILSEHAAPPSPARRAEKPPEAKPSKIKRFQVSPVVENKALPGESVADTAAPHVVTEDCQSPTKLGDATMSTTPHTQDNSYCATTPQPTATTPHQHGTTPDTTFHHDDMAPVQVQPNQTQPPKLPQTIDNSLETVKKKLEQLELDQASKRSNRPTMNLSLNEPSAVTSGQSTSSEQRQATPPLLSPATTQPHPLLHSPDRPHPVYAENTETYHQPVHSNDVSVMSDLEANLAMVFNHREPLVMPPKPDLAQPQQPLSAATLPGIIPLDPAMGQESCPQGYTITQDSLPHGYSLDHESVPGYPQYQVVLPVQQQYHQQIVLSGQQQHGEQVMVTEPDGHHVGLGDISNTGYSVKSLGDASTTTYSVKSVDGGHSVKSLEDVMGDPPRQSTPVSSPERPQQPQEAGGKFSRFAVQKVDEAPAVELEPGGEGQLYSRSCSIAASASGRTSIEAEHYDSSPSPGSCYDTASESVEPTLLQMYGDQVRYNGPVQAQRTECLGYHGMAAPGADTICVEPRRPSHSWPATWPDSTRPLTTLADSTGQAAQVPRPADTDHHTSGDSIPVGCEASHLDISSDSGLASLIIQPPVLPPISTAPQDQFRQPQVQENFCPGPESTFMPVEPAKEPTLDVESVEDDHNEITEEESFIQNALNRLDQRHAAEMEILQRRMEELQRHYMKEKENLRVDLVSTLFNARKMVHQQQEMAAMAQAGVMEVEEANASPQLLQLQQQKQLIQQQINEHMRQQQQVQQHQQNFQQLQSAGQRDVQQQQLLQQQLQQQLNSLMFSPPPGHTSRGSQGPPNTSPAQQVLQPVPARYAYVSNGNQPQLVTINGQQLQVVGGLHGQQIVALQGAPGQPQQFFSLPPDQQIQQLSIPRPQSFLPTRFSPRQVEQEGREKEGEEEHRIIERLDASSVMSEPSRPLVMEQHKRDSFSDSGAENSGCNTPTRGRTITEGLLRYVQDSSVARPQQRYSNVENPGGHLPPLHGQAHKTGSSFQTPGLPQNPPFHPQSLQHSLTQLPGSGYVPGHPALQRQSGRESVPLAQGRDSVPLVRDGRDSVPTGEPQACHVPVIQAVAEQPQPPYPSVIQQIASYPGHSYPGYAAQYQGTVTRGYTHPMPGSAPPYTGPAPPYPGQANYVYSQFAGANPLQTFPPGPMCSTPGSVGGFYPPNPGYQVTSPPPPSSFQPVSSSAQNTGEVTTIRQPIMSSTAQPSQVPAGYSSVSGMIPVMMMPPSCLPSGVYRTAIPPSPLSPPVPHSHTTFRHPGHTHFPSNQSMSGSYHEGQDSEHHEVPDKPA
jgi:hypothetical protein